MGLFSKNKVSHEAEREAVALEAAIMARIATITTSHDRVILAEDEADLELLASMSTGTASLGDASTTAHDEAHDDTYVMPDMLLAALANPSPDMMDRAHDYTSLIPAPLTTAVTEAPGLSYADAEFVPTGMAEAQAEAPNFAPAISFFSTPADMADGPVAELGHGVAFAEPASPDLAEASLLSGAQLEAEPVMRDAPHVADPTHAPAELLVALPPVAIPPNALANPFAVTPENLAGNALLAETTKHLRSIGAVNILVAGQTGVGKSTLVNSVFGEAFAATAAGSPVTQHAEWFVSDTVPLRILDTRGLEAKDYSVTLNALRAEIDNSRTQHDEKNQLHMAWVCISTPSSRVQECELDVIKLLNKYQIPVIIVLTKDDDDEDFPGIVERIVTEKGGQFTAIVAVRALARKTRPAVGLEALVTATFTALPVAHKAAFAAAQKISRDLNRTTAETYVTVAASAAAAASVIPIPFADMAAIAPIQASMLVGISNAFGVQLERAQIMQLISTVLGCLAITMAGGWIIGSVLKFIPGPGSLIGAMMNATVAGALTRTLGRTYIRFLYAFLEVNRRLPTADEIFDLFPTFYKAGRKVAA